LRIWETKTARPASALANNLPADDADNRFHGGFYGAGTVFGQGGEERSGVSRSNRSSESIAATKAFAASAENWLGNS
jgi:hypothetical protein